MIGRCIISLEVLYRFQDSSHLLIDQLVLQADLPPSGANEMIIIEGRRLLGRLLVSHGAVEEFVHHVA